MEGEFRLPREIWIEVFHHLSSLDDLRRCRLVKKEWSNWISTNDHIWKAVCLRQWNVDEKEFVLCIKTWQRASRQMNLSSLLIYPQEVTRIVCESANPPEAI